MPGPRKVLLADRDDLFVVHDFLSPEECDYYVTMSESVGFGDAPISTTSGPVMRKDIRNNDRVMIDDPTIAATIWERLRPFLAERPLSFMQNQNASRVKTSDDIYTGRVLPLTVGRIGVACDCRCALRPDQRHARPGSAPSPPSSGSAALPFTDTSAWCRWKGNAEVPAPLTAQGDDIGGAMTPPQFKTQA